MRQNNNSGENFISASCINSYSDKFRQNICTKQVTCTSIVKFIPVNLCLLLVAEANIFHTLQGNAGNAIRDLTS